MDEAEALHKGQGPSSILIAEQEETPGQMDLYWSREVQWSPGAVSADAVSSVQSGESGEKKESKTDPPALKVENLVTPPYDNVLESDEFRLICLYPPQHDQDPLHMELKTYNRDRCPEYETTSYTWGGENDDRTPRRPTYVGPYWDILLQTDNCWSMLKFLRPYQGVRQVWVDSVCINQRHTTEQGTQVSTMGLIYQKCLRTILYLGKEAVGDRIEVRTRRPFFDLLEGRSAARDVASEMRNDTRPNLQAVLENIYFTRIWVIQELTLCAAIVMPFPDTDYLVGNGEVAHFVNYWAMAGLGSEWLKASQQYAPWLSSICDGGASLSLYEAVEKASKSEATDRGDKNFGVLGLVEHNKPRHRRGMWARKQGHRTFSIRPNYSIFYAHATLGISAYLLINDGELGVLSNARGTSEDPAANSLLPS